MKIISVSVAIMLGLCWSAHWSASAQTRYCNERYAYCIVYPEALLHPMPESQNGDGRCFIDRGGVKRLCVWGTGNWNFNEEGMPISLLELYKQELKGGRFPQRNAHRRITYKTFHKTSFIISGTEADEIFYLKVVEQENAFCYAYLHYSAAQASQYDSVAVLIGRKFTSTSFTKRNSNKTLH